MAATTDDTRPEASVKEWADGFQPDAVPGRDGSEEEDDRRRRTCEATP